MYSVLGVIRTQFCYRSEKANIGNTQKRSQAPLQTNLFPRAPQGLGLIWSHRIQTAALHTWQMFTCLASGWSSYRYPNLTGEDPEAESRETSLIAGHTQCRAERLPILRLQELGQGQTLLAALWTAMTIL